MLLCTLYFPCLWMMSLHFSNIFDVIKWYYFFLFWQLIQRIYTTETEAEYMFEWTTWKILLHFKQTKPRHGVSVEKLEPTFGTVTNIAACNRNVCFFLWKYWHWFSQQLTERVAWILSCQLWNIVCADCLPFFWAHFELRDMRYMPSPWMVVALPRVPCMHYACIISSIFPAILGAY